MSKLMGIGFWEARAQSTALLSELGAENGLVVNVFVDLFCCVLIMYFIDYTPKKYFQGKKIVLFRLLALLPILYELMSAVFMGLLTMSELLESYSFSLPVEVLPLLGKKPIGMIIAFVLICIYVRLRKRRYLKKGGTEEGYEEFLKTNRNSTRFARNMAFIFLFVAIVDFAIYFAFLILSASDVAEDVEVVMLLAAIIPGFTIGKSVPLLFVTPLVFFFSYQKTHKNAVIDKFVPIGGIIWIIFSAIESLFLGIIFVI